MIVSDIISNLSENSKELVYTYFQQNIPIQFKCFVNCAINESAWSKLDSSSTNYSEQCAEFINNVQAKVKSEDNFKNFIEERDLRVAVKLLKEDQEAFNRLISEVRAIIAYVHILNDQDNMDCDQRTNDWNVLKLSIEELKRYYLMNDLNMISFNQDDPEHCVALQQVYNNYGAVIEVLGKVPDHMRKVIDDWKLRFSQSLINYPFDDNIDEIQNIFKQFVKKLLKFQNFLNLVANNNQALQIISYYRNELHQIFTRLMKNCLVIRTKTTVINLAHVNIPDITCLFLFDNTLAGYNPQCQMKLIIAKEAEGNLDKENDPFPNKGIELFNRYIILKNLSEIKIDGREILNTMKPHLSNRHGTNVAEKIYNFVIDVGLRFNNDNQGINIKETAQANTVISHTSQMTTAMSALIWAYNGWPTWTGTDPGCAPLSGIIDMVDNMFKYKLGRGLNDTNKRFIASRYCPEVPLTDWPKTMVSRTTFLGAKKDGLTILDWLHNTIELTSKFFSKMWEDGLIMGFISREEIVNYLVNYPVGTVILKYSETLEKGGVSVCYYHHEKSKGQYMAPFTSKHMSETTSLADLLKDCRDNKLKKDIFKQLLTSDITVIAKDEALATYYSDYSENDNESGEHQYNGVDVITTIKY